MGRLEEYAAKSGRHNILPIGTGIFAHDPQYDMRGVAGASIKPSDTPQNNAPQYTTTLLKTGEDKPQQAAVTEKPADGNYIGLMRDMMGPTPAEREAQERKLATNKAKMAGWLGLFQGLGALGDLYYASKGVTPSKPNNTAQTILNQNYADEKQRLDNLYKNRQAYANMLYNLQRQAGEDERKNKLNDAQIRWYDTREEMARLKADNDKLKAEQQAQLAEARRKKIELQIQQLQELHPLQKKKLEATIKNVLHNAGRPYGGSGRGASGSDPFVVLAQELNENPDVIGPILQQQGVGYYDDKSKQFQFFKNPTKGMVTTATERARGKGKGDVIKVDW